MKRIAIDGVEHIVFLERGWGDDGDIINNLVLQPDGAFLNYRTWFKDAAAAKAVYDSPEKFSAAFKGQQGVAGEVIAKRRAPGDTATTDTLKADAEVSAE